jgi:hypothetical protein
VFAVRHPTSLDFTPLRQPQVNDDHPVPPQNLVDPTIVDVSTLGVKLAYPDD